MKINYVLLKGFKRFNNSRISEFEAEFESPIQVIVGSNSSGKSSLLKELSPLPSIRTDYEKDGLKELHITHDNHSFVLKTDFSNRVSPHSFKMDGVELNDGHTSDVQEELSIKHFGFTPAIRNLVYSKTQLCSMTPSARKEMFLNINPMDLSLILGVHKLATNKFRDCKANLKLLYARKGNLEAQMLKPEILAQHQATKDKLSKEILAIDKIIYALEQHINSLQDRFREDIDYQRQCTDNNQQIIPSEKILHECHEIVKTCMKFTDVPRGDEFPIANEKLHIKREKLKVAIDEIKKNISAISSDINDYNSHLKESSTRTVSDVEKEIKDLDLEIKKYTNLPKNPIPDSLISLYDNKVDAIKNTLFIFKDSDVKMIAPEIILGKIQEADTLKVSLANLNTKLGELNDELETCNKEIADHKQKASIPTNCTSKTCGLRLLFTDRLKNIEARSASLKVEVNVIKDKITSTQKQFKEVSEFIEPYVKFNLVSHFNSLLSELNTDYFKIEDWNKTLINKINVAPLEIVKQLTELVTGSKAVVELNKLLTKKSMLEMELKTLIKSSAISSEFLKNKILEKEAQIKELFKKLNMNEKEAENTESLCALYAEYASACRTVQDFQNLYEKGERAILVHQAIEYWKKLGRQFVEAKRSISEELRNIESIIREQEVLKQSYEAETLKLIDNISETSILNEKVMEALSPNSGIPHKSMVKYLNAMINNVNYFLSQLWSFKLAIKPINLDQPLDYKFPIEIGMDTAPDINHLSDGQTEAVNLMWVLSIMLQMKMLNKIPLFGDELGRTMDPVHRQHLLDFLNKLIEGNLVEQLFLINHYAALSSGFTGSDVIVLDDTNLAELPPEVNRNCHIVRY